MPPQFYENGAFVKHPLEEKFKASGWDILSAIERGFRAQVDVKGKLAEYFLYRIWSNFKRAASSTTWNGEIRMESRIFVSR